MPCLFPLIWVSLSTIVVFQLVLGLILKTFFDAPLEEHRFYDIFYFFGFPVFILKTSPLSKCVRKTLYGPFPAVSHSALVKMRTFVHL